MKSLNINAVHTFLQIVQNSRKPLEVIREAIANAYDNGATEVEITVEYNKSENTINIIIKDDGSGITRENIEFLIFGLGNSTKLNAEGFIGNKGVGTLLYLKSQSVTITSFKDGKGAQQDWIEPYKSLHRFINDSNLTRKQIGIKEPIDLVYNGEGNGTTIEIRGFLHKNPLEYHHDNLKDFILWFTKMASFEDLLENSSNRPFNVKLKGLLFKEVKEKEVKESYSSTEALIETGYDSYIDKDLIITREDEELIDLGFSFPPISNNEELLQDEILNRIDYTKEIGEVRKEIVKKLKTKLVKKYTSDDSLFDNFELEFTYQDSLDSTKSAKIEFAVYKIGDKVRNEHNRMIKRSTNDLPSYGYLVSERYGIYLAKDYIPVQLINTELQSIGGGGSGKTQYLGFFNCQNIDLTIDRTGAATIDEELQIKLNNKINKLMSLIDENVERTLNEMADLVLTMRAEESSHHTNDDEDTTTDEEETDNLRDIDDDEDEGTQNPEDNDTGRNFSSEAEILEYQRKLTAKATRIHNIKLKKEVRVNTAQGEVILREPSNESELYGLLMKITSIKPDIFNFDIMDYNTTNGIDNLARYQTDNEDDYTNLFHIELKNNLKPSMNHLLNDVKYIICWTIHESLRNSMLLKDKYQNSYRLDSEDSFFVLKRASSPNVIKIIELKNVIENSFGQFSFISSRNVR
ncbi:ATP-binding protein [Priestia aryabhattai]|uniref:ATP-binding protein n=1 Tax=Priestia aryabhattai TaxID=412384 RepID=UPI003D7D533C